MKQVKHRVYMLRPFFEDVAGLLMVLAFCHYISFFCRREYFEESFLDGCIGRLVYYEIMTSPWIFSE